jgi:hypothetical protein
MEENLHITKQTHQQQQRTTVSKGKKNQHKRKHRKRPKKNSICKAQKLLSHLFFSMHKMSSL